MTVSIHFSHFFLWRQPEIAATMPTTLKTLRLQYGQIPMQYEVQHCTFREHDDADPDMVGARCGRAPLAGFDTLVAGSSSVRVRSLGALRVCVCAHARLCACAPVRFDATRQPVFTRLYARAHTRPEVVTASKVV